MKLSTYFLLILAAAGIGACSSNEGTTNPDPNPTQKQEPPAHKKTYDVAKGGVQITAIYYNQDSNEAVTGLKDEWVVIESDRDMSLEGWILDASDNQRLPLHQIHRKLLVYTKQGPGVTSDTVLAWGRGTWIWNNSDPDIATLFNDKGDLVDAMTY